MTTRTKERYDIIVHANNHSTTITCFGNICTLRQAIATARDITRGNHFQQATNYSSYYVKNENGAVVAAQYKYGLGNFHNLEIEQ